MNSTPEAYGDYTEEEKQKLRDAGCSEEDIAMCYALSHGYPTGDIIQFSLPRLEDEDEDAYSARYVAAIERDEHLRLEPMASSATSVNGKHSEAKTSKRKAVVPSSTAKYKKD